MTIKHDNLLYFKTYSSSCSTSAKFSQAVGDFITNRYSHLDGSETSVSFSSESHSISTCVERTGPFQQLCPLSYFCAEYLLFSGPTQLSQELNDDLLQIY